MLLKTTDADPGVGISNTEVRFRDIARIHSSDSGQNEAERSNTAIGDALVDGSALKWDYYGPFDGLEQDEIKKLSATELAETEADCMERNA